MNQELFASTVLLLTPGSILNVGKDVDERRVVLCCCYFAIDWEEIIHELFELNLTNLNIFFIFARLSLQKGNLIKMALHNLLKEIGEQG